MSALAPGGFAPGDTIRLRPGVALPDWSLAPDPAARAALAASMAIAGRRERWAGLSAAEDAVWRAVLRHFARTGRAPSLAALAREAGRPQSEACDVLRGLARRDLLVIDGADAVLAAYPFSATPTPHRVEVNGGAAAFALCAIDALGLGGMLGDNSAVRSACAHCGAGIAVRTRDAGRDIASASPDAAVVWCGIDYAGGCAATSGCAEKLFFCGDAHLEAWRAGRAAADGFRLTMSQALQAGLALFVPMLR